MLIPNPLAHGLQGALGHRDEGSKYSDRLLVPVTAPSHNHCDSPLTSAAGKSDPFFLQRKQQTCLKKKKLKNMGLSSRKPEQNSIPTEPEGSSIDFNPSFSCQSLIHSPSSPQELANECQPSSGTCRTAAISQLPAARKSRNLTERARNDLPEGHSNWEGLAQGQVGASALPVDTETQVRQ